MGHGKLKKFEENKTFKCLLQFHTDMVVVKTISNKELKERESDEEKTGKGPKTRFELIDQAIKGKWREVYFNNNKDIVVELGCGKGEYTINLAIKNPRFNHIGVDIKGARLWSGAKFATEHTLANVAFLRTKIEFIEAFFAKDEISQIWLTFSDPQLKSENNRLSSPNFLNRYRNILKKDGIVHLKTDSIFLYNYTLAVIKRNNLKLIVSTDDLYGKGKEQIINDKKVMDVLSPVCGQETVNSIFEVQTFYESMFLRQNYKIHYLSFFIEHEGAYEYPDDFDVDYWKAKEGKRSAFKKV